MAEAYDSLQTPDLVKRNELPLADWLLECCELLAGRTSKVMGESGGEKLVKQLIIDEKCLKILNA